MRVRYVIDGIVIITSISMVVADVYLQNPRGSNNRLNENTRNRRNAKRMFDSENNARGGYNVGYMYYYQGSLLPIEWTNQHSCGNNNSNCDIMLQYMCEDNVRDGVETTVIPSDKSKCNGNDCNTDSRYGMNENYDYYHQCRLRQRNKGIFTADQNLYNRWKQSAMNTRQSATFARYGYECAEERDYYPYWKPSPWKDIAILTTNVTRCMHYQSESENVKAREYCYFPPDIISEMIDNGAQGIIPITKDECEAMKYPANEERGVSGVWKVSEAHGVPAPQCRESEWSRDNHHGNGVDGYPLNYNWTVPAAGSHQECVLRIRYNISTSDFKGWGVDSVNASHNAAKVGEATKVNIGQKFGLNESEAERRGYVYETNPVVQIFPGYALELRLAINTAQFGRTFEDRSHVFGIRSRPSTVPRNSVVYNVNVRGKRGNIVQTFPAVEYDFIPNTLHVATGDYVHFQWTGSNNNPRNNAGQGLAGSDRSNIVLLAYPPAEGGNNSEETDTSTPVGVTSTYGRWSCSYPEHITNITFLNLHADDIIDLATLGNAESGETLDNASPYFDLSPPRKMTLTRGSGMETYHFMCTRNNNFSNRNQKGRIIVQNHHSAHIAVGWNGGNHTLFAGTLQLIIERGTFHSLQKMHIEHWPADEVYRSFIVNGEGEVPEYIASDFIVIHPEDGLATNGNKFEVDLQVTPYSDAGSLAVYRSTSHALSEWRRYDFVRYTSGTAGQADRVTFYTDRGGVYVIVNEEQFAGRSSDENELWQQLLDKKTMEQMNEVEIAG